MYQIGNVIGQGTFGEVRVVKNIVLQKQFAMRVVKRRYLDEDPLLWKRF